MVTLTILHMINGVITNDFKKIYDYLFKKSKDLVKYV